MTSDQWVKTLEQVLLLILILGRWMLPKGKLSHNQLSQLLLVYIGTASDIVELFEAFKEDEVTRPHRIARSMAYTDVRITTAWFQAIKYHVIGVWFSWQHSF